MNSDIVQIKNESKSTVVLTGPHNGWSVPDTYTQEGKPLGVETYWFDPNAENRRHEACDWGMQNLFDEIENQNSDICLVSAQISRLVVDLNRIPSVMVYETSSETGEPIPGNMNLDDTEIQQRLDTYYTPYQSTIDHILQDTKEKFGHVIWLDMHSFTPTWQGEKRNVGIGTLKMERNDFTLGVEKLLEKRFQDHFVADHPYDLSLSPYREINAGGVIAARNNVDYFGIEIRNDLLNTPNQLKAMASGLLDIINQLA